MIKKVWIVVADSSQARLFSTTTPGKELVLKHELCHPASRDKPGELLTDRPGRDSNNSQWGTHTMGHEKDVKTYEAQRFARQISDTLEEANQDKAFAHLYLIAPPQMLGLLRKELGDEVRNKVTQAIDRNLVKEDTPVIRRHLPEYL